MRTTSTQTNSIINKEKIGMWSGMKEYQAVRKIDSVSKHLRSEVYGLQIWSCSYISTLYTIENTKNKQNVNKYSV